MIKKIMLCIGMIFIFVCNASSAQVMLLQPVSAVLKGLQNSGYITVESVELNGDEYDIMALNNEGNLTKIRINSHSGQIIEVKKLDSHVPMLEIVDKVEGLGYSGICNIKRTNGSFEINAIDPDGKKVKLTVNAMSGKVTKM